MNGAETVGMPIASCWDMARGNRDGIVRAIGVFKLVKSALLIAISVGAFGHAQHQLAADLRNLIAGPHVSALVAKLDSTRDTDVDKIGIGALLYAAVFSVEGIGLLLRKRWAEWLTVVVTGSFVPLEIYEMVEHPSVAKAVTIALNVAIVIYLVWRRVTERH